MKDRPGYEGALARRNCRLRVLPPDDDDSESDDDSEIGEDLPG
jgi:hypothetical protein